MSQGSVGVLSMISLPYDSLAIRTGILYRMGLVTVNVVNVLQWEIYAFLNLFLVSRSGLRGLVGTYGGVLSSLPVNFGSLDQTGPL